MSRFNWVSRASAFDKSAVLQLANITQSHRERAAMLQEEAIADAAELTRDLIADAREGQLSQIRLEQFSSIVGQPGAFLLESHRTLFGDKTQVHTTSNETRLWTFKKLEE